MSSLGARREGFTLLEILIVVALIGIVTATVGIGELSALSFDFENAEGRLEAFLRQTGERAVATGVTHRLVIDLETQRIRTEWEVDVAEPPEANDLAPPLPRLEFRPVPSLQGRWEEIGTAQVRISRVVIGGELYDRDVVSIGFAGDGSAGDAQIELLEDDGTRSVFQVMPFTGEVRILDEEDLQDLG